MKEFVSVDIQSVCDEAEIKICVERLFLDFTWHSGDSDTQGPYLFGVNEDCVRIQLWLGERPIAMSISFRDMPLDIPERESKMIAITNRVRDNLVAALGEAARFDVR